MRKVRVCTNSSGLWLFATQLFVIDHPKVISNTRHPVLMNSLFYRGLKILDTN